MWGTQHETAMQGQKLGSKLRVLGTEVTDETWCWISWPRISSGDPRGCISSQGSGFLLSSHRGHSSPGQSSLPAHGSLCSLARLGRRTRLPTPHRSRFPQMGGDLALCIAVLAILWARGLRTGVFLGKLVRG